MNETLNNDTTTAVKGIDIAAYLVRDPQRQIAFYRDVLGMTPTMIDDQGRGAEFTLADGSTFGVWKPEDGETGGAIMFAVDDAKRAVEVYRGRGLELSDVMESPVCFMAFGQDPEGNSIIIHQRKVRD
ncbi:MAG TPA: VOC family protein [Candidatus Cybelea sp.]|jgi:predicted enzyme related to lactoylglutathione lyase